MSRISFEVSALPDGRTGRILALALTLLAGLVLWIGLIGPLVGLYQDRAERIAHRDALAQRMDALVQSLPQLRQAASGLGGAANAGVAQAALLEGSSDAVAAASLQQILQDMAARAGAEVASAETLPATQLGTYRQIGLRVSLNTQWSVLIRLLAAIGAGSPRMLVDDLQVHAPRVLVQAADPPMNASLTIYAYRADAPAGVSPTAPASSTGMHISRETAPISLTRSDTPMNGKGLQ